MKLMLLNMRIQGLLIFLLTKGKHEDAFIPKYYFHLILTQAFIEAFMLTCPLVVIVFKNRCNYS